MATELRLVSWNVYDAFRSKFGHLERLKPDIALLQEVRPECLRYAALEAGAHWLGDAAQKGLAAIGYNGWKLTPSGIELADKWFLPLVATKADVRLHVVAVWVDSRKDCVPPTLRTLASLRDFIHSAPTIMAGDFNQTVSLDRGRGPGRRFADVLAAMDACGMSSAWHSNRNEEHGKESTPTFYHLWNLQKPFHIDFAFGTPPCQVMQVSLGTFEQYTKAEISDHVPLTVDYRLS